MHRAVISDFHFGPTSPGRRLRAENAEKIEKGASIRKGIRPRCSYAPWFAEIGPGY